MSFTDNLPENVVCACTRKGPHVSGPDCPTEGAAYFDHIDFDSMLLRIRYDHDPVVMALIGHAEHLLWTTRAARVIMIAQSQYMEKERTAWKKSADEMDGIEQTWARQVDDLQRKVAAMQDQVRIAKDDREHARKLSADAKARIGKVMEQEGQWRAIIEELAIKTGYFEDAKTPYGWSPEELLRKETLARMGGKLPRGKSEDEVLPHE